jgi:hypothetical protein
MNGGVLNGREKRILALAALFFASGLVFFGMRMAGWGGENTIPVTQDATEEAPRVLAVKGSLMHLPEPLGYTRFVYDPQTPVLVNGTCNDAYYTVLVFPADIDYRRSPLDARYNVATACAKGDEFTTPLDLVGRGLEEGREYYIVRAHQGATGEWYNPY